MPTPHSSINYVEPNMISPISGINSSWKLDDGFERAPRLEDYSIMLNLEVEVCSRKNIFQGRTITKDVLILSFTTNEVSGKSSVNFMGGTKIECSDGDNVNYLTTNYADMYVGDLINYGTTEMIGVKSVDIEYQKSCVPIINIKFTDVRGLSLFQPTELSRTDVYQGIGGINASNVAQSFFQCFFRVPMPKFTITIKGFYGKPVTYEVLCDKFETSFNSDTGDFDINTRFIGYTYSFLTDIVMDALLAAPYSDYGGVDGDYNKYWAEQVNNGKFTIPNKEGTVDTRMPTLYEIYKNVRLLLDRGSGTTSPLTEEEQFHTNEINDLKKLRDLYSLWYSTLFNICCKKYGKEYCFLFKDSDGEYRILILTTPLTENVENLSQDYLNFSDEFKNINQNLNTAIDEFNSKGYQFRKIENVSSDFSAYKRKRLFNPIVMNQDNNLVFNGFDKSCNLPQTEVFKTVFIGNTPNDETQIDTHKNHVLATIYGGGANQYIDCYSIDVDYRFINERINFLEGDAKRDVEEKNEEKRLKALNDEMIRIMEWYPSVENFTKIMMAHLETLMKQLYDCVDKCSGRKASTLGVSSQENVDVNNGDGDPEIPPFPRVFKKVYGDDNIAKDEDAWVGEFTNGIGFEEVNFINGLFNAADKIVTLYKDTEKAYSESQREIPPNRSESPIIKYPLSSLDFYINTSPYGSADEMANDEDFERSFAGRVAIRMFSILGINYFRKQFGDEFYGKVKPELVGRIEADNFVETTRITNDRLFTAIRNGAINSDRIIDMITNTNQSNTPWGTVNLFSKNRLTRYELSEYFGIYPIQNISFNRVLTSYNHLKQGGVVDNCDGDVILTFIPNQVTDREVNSIDDYGFGTTLILDDVNRVENQLNNAVYGTDNGYNEIKEEISEVSRFDGISEVYNNFIDKSTPHSISIKDLSTVIGGFVSTTAEDKNAYIVVRGENNTSVTIQYTALDNFANPSRNGDFTNGIITEIFGFKKEGDVYIINKERSFLTSTDVIPLSSKNVGGYSLTTDEAKVTFALMGIILDLDVVGKYLNNPLTVTYLPKLAVLQIGAIIYANGGIGSMILSVAGDIKREASKYLPVGNYPIAIFDYIASLSRVAKHQFEKYYLDWIKSHANYCDHICKSSSPCYWKQEQGSWRRLLRQDNDFVQEMTNELLKAVCVVRLSLPHDTNKASNYSIPYGDIKKYLDGFMKRLEEKYGIGYEEDENGNIVKTAKEPHNTTKDMKKELYRYMKQVYDKWIPMSSFADWQLDSFFIDKNKGGEEIGHKFYFIDSYYNDISNKLLINPKTLAEKIRALLSYEDINSMLLGFMGDMYSANKAMFMTIQNFADLKKEHSMDEMFTPLSYNSINWSSINKYPSFVVVYPYQASRNLDIPNGEYTNDGFMLNDEFETPLAIRTKANNENGNYRIPAFGVSYGKQYQSYFKKVNINMQSPVATEQSIRAKHAILISANNEGTKGVKSQDLYDVYATQSYTCDVEMMGCAWVQPLMYFVLLNVPMFRGSYMIMKVKHSIKPGEMTTTFTGCRMANVSNSLVENIFTDGKHSSISSNHNDVERQMNQLANLDNDCPYKIYPLFNNGSSDLIQIIKESEGGYAGNIDGKICTMRGVTLETYRSHFGASKSCDDLRNISDSEWWTIFKESFWDKWQADNIRNTSIANLLVDWTWGSGVYGIYYPQDVLGVARSQTESGIANAVAAINNYTNQSELFQKLWNRRKQHFNDIAANDKKKAKFLNGWMNRLNRFSYFDAASSVSDDNKDNIVEAFFKAVNRSALDTPSIGVELTYRQVGTVIEITQKNGQTDALPRVFDMILNSEYYDYILLLAWVYPDNGLQGEVPPSGIRCKVTESIQNNINSRGVVAYNSNLGDGSLSLEIPTTDGNPLLLRPLAKRLAKIGEDKMKKEAPQLKDLSGLEQYKPKNCNELTNSNYSGVGGGSSSGSLQGYTGGDDGIKVGSRLYKLLDIEHNREALNYMDSGKLGKNYKLLDARKVGAAAYKGCCTSGPTTWYHRISSEFPSANLWWSPQKVSTSNYKTTSTWLRGLGFNLVWYGHLSDAEKLDNSSFCPGDIATFHVYDSRKRATSHGAMWTGKDWRSDCIQRALSCYPNGSDRDGAYSVCIWRMPSLVSEGLGINNTPNLY